MARLIDERVVDGLCPELRSLLADELAVGNSICETSEFLGLEIATVWLARRFTVCSIPAGVTYSCELDPRDNFEQYYCRSHGQMLLASLSA